MQAPVAKFAQTLNEVPGKFVRTLAALRDQQEQQPAQTANASAFTSIDSD